MRGSSSVALRLAAAGILGPALAVPLTTPAVGALTSESTPADPSLRTVQVLAFNDLHGRLETSGLYIDPTNGSAEHTSPGAVKAGGAAYLAAHLRALRQTNPDTAVVSAGDLVGTSPILSGYYHDQPAIEAANAMGLDLNVVGNHDLDEGLQEVRRLQNGGCHPVDGCPEGRTFAGAQFPFLGANVLDTATNQPVLPSHVIKDLGGTRVAFVGVSFQYTPGLVPATGIAGLRFAQEAATVNALVPELRRQGADAVVVVVHSGATQKKNAGINDCENINGLAVQIAKAVVGQVDAVIGAHTHTAFSCRIPDPATPGRSIPLTSAASAGRVLTRLTLTIDPAAGRVLDSTAVNQVVTRDLPADPDVTRIVKDYKKLVQARRTRVVGHLENPATRTPNTAGESTMGSLVADAHLAATRGATRGRAQIALVQRASLGGDLPKGDVTAEQTYRVQSLGHRLVTMTLTGKHLRTALEQQYCKRTSQTDDHYIGLHVSAGFTYTRDTRKKCGSQVSLKTMKLHGKQITSTRTYRVTANALLATGGQGITALTKGTSQVTGVLDSVALDSYLATSGSVEVPTPNRIHLLGPAPTAVPLDTPADSYSRTGMLLEDILSEPAPAGTASMSGS